MGYRLAKTEIWQVPPRNFKKKAKKMLDLYSVSFVALSVEKKEKKGVL